MNTTKTVQKINEYQVTKIKKYAGFLLKSIIGDIWDKNTAATVITNYDLHLVTDICCLDVVNINWMLITQKEVYYMGFLTALKKSKLRLYSTVVFKDVKKVVFYVFYDKKKLLSSIKWAYLGIFLTKKSCFCLL